jgi:hypothetical protein
LPPTLSLDHGAVVLDPSTGSITVNVGALLRTLGARLNALPPNTDLLAYVLKPGPHPEFRPGRCRQRDDRPGQGARAELLRAAAEPAANRCW